YPLRENVRTARELCIKCDVMNNMVDKMHNMMYNEIGTAGKRQEKSSSESVPKTIATCLYIRREEQKRRNNVIPEKLNELAVAAKNGDKAAMEEVYRYFIPKIDEIADEIWYMLKDESAFRYACYKQIEYAVGYYDPSKANFETVMMKTIYRTKYKYLNDEYRSDDRENVLMIESMTVN